MFYTQPYLFMGVLCHMSQYSFNFFMTSCCPSISYLSSLSTLLALSHSYLTAFFSLYVSLLPHTSSLLIFLLNNNLLFYFSTSFFGVHSLEMCAHASYMQLSTSFLLLKIFSQKFHQTLVCSSSISCLHPFFNANVWLHVTQVYLFFIGVLVAVIY